MALLNWVEKYSVGSEILDRQHQNLINIVNRFYSALQAGEENEVTPILFYELVEYTNYHFKTEEELMLRCGYPDLAIHKNQHLNLQLESAEYLKKYKAGEKPPSGQILIFLQNWLSKHVIESDLKLKPWIASLDN